MSEYKLFINGAYQAVRSGELAESLNPATGEVFARVHQRVLKTLN